MGIRGWSGYNTQAISCKCRVANSLETLAKSKYRNICSLQRVARDGGIDISFAESH